MDNTTDQPHSSNKGHFKAKQDRGHVKHYILEKYLQAWLPKMSHGEYRLYQKILYVDGFAGTGEFEKSGEDGSPAVALKAVLGHSHGEKLVVDIHMIFIELNPKSAKALEEKLGKVQYDFRTPVKRKNKITWEVINGNFVEEMDRLLDNPEFIGAPIFLFADPFGYDGKIMPMRLLNQVLARPSSEVFLNVMDGSANRFFNIENREDAITQLVGSEKWIEAVRGEDLNPSDRILRFITVYKQNLNAEYKLHFGMRSKKNNRHMYNLVFGTNHPAGLEVMKRAMTNASQDIESLYFSEFLTSRVPQVDVTTKEYKIVCARNTLKRLWWEFSDTEEPLSGSAIANFILRETPYFFNFKRQLGKLLQSAVTIGSGKFDERSFRLSEITAAGLIQLEIQGLQLEEPVVSKKGRLSGPKKPNAKQKVGSLNFKKSSPTDIMKGSRGSRVKTPIKNQHSKASTSSEITPDMTLVKLWGQQKARQEQQTHVRNLSNEMHKQVNKVETITDDDSSSEDESVG